MPEPPATRLTLLARIKDGQDVEAWREFVAIYGPVIYRFARHRGLQDADAADLMQEVMRSVARNAHRMNYDPAKGTFRGWLYTVTRNKIYNHLLSQRNRAQGTGDSGGWERLENLSSRKDDDLEAEWEREYQRRLSLKAMERVKSEFQPTTWQAFWKTAVEGQPAAEAGRELSMSPGAVYVAKSRVLARLRDEVQAMLEQDDLG